LAHLSTRPVKCGDSRPRLSGGAKLRISPIAKKRGELSLARTAGGGCPHVSLHGLPRDLNLRRLESHRI